MSAGSSAARVAIVHDWLITFGGAERVLAEMLRLYPEATVFTLMDFFSPAERGRLGAREIRTSFMQRLPRARRAYRSYLPLMPLAAEQLDLSGFDLVISSAHAVAQGVITHPRQAHVAYVNGTMRYAWENAGSDLAASGLGRGARGAVARLLLHRVRQWDWLAFQRPRALIANSAYQALRLANTYRRGSAVVYPPVAVDEVPLRREKQDFYMFAGRLVRYKRVDLLVEAFRRLGCPLVIAGDGPERARLQRGAAANVRFVGWQPPRAVAEMMASAAACVFPAEEYFGIAAVEAQAAGTPVIASALGGTAEVVRGLDRDRPTGCLFERPDADAVFDAVRSFQRERRRISPESCRQNALRFSRENFAAGFVAEVDAALGRARGPGTAAAGAQSGAGPGAGRW